MNPNFSYILVDSTSQALQIEKALITGDISCRLIPVPRHLSSDCGVCVRIATDDLPVAREIITSKKLGYQSIEVL